MAYVDDKKGKRYEADYEAAFFLNGVVIRFEPRDQTGNTQGAATPRLADRLLTLA